MLRAMAKDERTTPLLAAAAGVLGAGAALAGAGIVPSTLGESLRWMGLAMLAGWCWRKRMLTPWIFWAMVAGVELGVDAPGFAVQLRVLSDIFLRLIKTIVSPLILATLITGIAAHGDLKGVGRMGLKALVYFEVATTLALVIGLAAINLTKAGVGLAMPVTAGSPVIATAVAGTRWDEFLLHVFPENLAKSVAE